MSDVLAEVRGLDDAIRESDANAVALRAGQMAAIKRGSGAGKGASGAGGGREIANVSATALALKEAMEKQDGLRVRLKQSAEGALRSHRSKGAKWKELKEKEALLLYLRSSKRPRSSPRG